MVYQPENRLPALVLCLVSLAVMSGCATGGGYWDKFPEEPVEDTKLSSKDESTLRFRQIVADVYGIDLKDMMGPFEYELDGFVVEEVGFLGPYFDEDVPETREKQMMCLVFQYSMSHLGEGSPPDFGNYSLLFCIGDKDMASVQMGIYYGEGCLAGGGTAPEGPTEVTEYGLEVGLRGFMTPDHSWIGLYGQMGGRFSSMSWSRTPSSEEAGYGGIIVHEDSGNIPSSAFYVGVGAVFLRTKAFHLGVITTVGMRFFDYQEMSKFESQMEYKLGVEVNVPF